MTFHVIEWLLQCEPWIRYRSLTDILLKDEDEEEVIVAKKAIPEHTLIKKILDWQNEDGY
jgi:hypothetical protein